MQPSSSSTFRNFLVLTLILVLPLPVKASISISMQEPKWEFLLQNQPTLQTQAQLAAGESGFARQIQPLLAAQNYSAVMKAFESRDLASDSVALKQLRGQVLLSLKRYPEAEQALQAALKSMPDLALAHRSLSMVYLLQKQYEPARKHLRRSLELGVADVQVYGQLAYINLQLGQPGSAIAGYQTALLLEPDNTQWQQGLLYALINSQAFDQAQGLLDSMLKANPQSADLWLQRGQIALRQNRPDQALSSLEAAIQLGERNVDNLAITAQLHVQHGSPERAVELVASNIQRFIGKGDRIEAVDQIGAWLVFEENWSQLKKLLNAVGTSKAKLPGRYRSRFDFYQARLALAQGNTQQAQNRLQQAVESDPTNGDALLALAELLAQRQRADRALLYFVRAEALPSFKERALLGRAQLEIDRKNFADALRILRQIAQANPARGDVIANIQLLENLVRNQG